MLAAQSAHKHLMPHWLVHLGLLGVFGVSTIDASPVPMPIPGSTDLLILIFCAHRISPWLQVLAGVAGSVAGGYLTWSAGKHGGERMLARYVPKRFGGSLSHWVKKHGAVSVGISVLLPPPIPLFPFLMAAGALGVKRKQTLLAIAAGRILRYGLEAALGVFYGKEILGWWTRNLAKWSDAILWTFISLLVAGIAFGFWRYRHDKRRMDADVDGVPDSAAAASWQ